jgi:NAD(P)H-dependent FMN reductase
MISNKDRVLVILGSSRNYELIDLHQKHIEYYSYDRHLKNEDDFLPIAQAMLNHDVIVFATPVYWYTMSGQMKVFLDRLTELTDIHKPIGKALKGKKTYLIACGGSPSLPEGFELPFKGTSEYFDMEFIQTLYKKIK